MRDLEYMLERISLWEKLPVLLLDAEDQVYHGGTIFWMWKAGTEKTRT